MNSEGRRKPLGPGQNPKLSADDLLKAKPADVVRLARWLGIDVEVIQKKPNAHYRLCCAIVRWNKKHPQCKSQGNLVGSDHDARHADQER